MKLVLATHLQEKIGRAKLDTRLACVSSAASVFPYLKQSHREQFFSDFFGGMKKVGYQWTAYDKHGDLLRNLIEFGSLNFCPPSARTKILKSLGVQREAK